MFGHFDPTIMAMRSEMDERQLRIDAESKLNRALKVIERFEFGGEGACLQCAALHPEKHSDTCEVWLLLSSWSDWCKR